MMEKRNIRLAGWALGWILVGIGLGYGLAHRSEPRYAAAGPAATKSDGAAGPRVLYWYDPMKPNQHFDKPGKSPFMDMDLVPMMAEVARPDDAGGVRIDPALTQNLGVRRVTVTKGRLQPVVVASGSLALDERLVSVIQARTAGFVERVYDRSTQDVLPEGALLADIRVPEWYGAQAEYLALRKAGETALAEAARIRLYQLGMSAEQVIRLQKTLVPLSVVTLASDRTGVLLELGVREGMTFAPGQTLARINGLGSLWLDVEIPEAERFGVAAGNRVSAQFVGDPSLHRGVVQSILPEMNKETRTVRARIEIPNPQGKLRPGMYARVQLYPNHGDSAQLLVPEEAIITVGGENRVILAEKEGHFLPVQVRVGRSEQGKVEILEGLDEGDQVVVSGQFLIDSEASLKGVLMRMNGGGTP